MFYTYYHRGILYKLLPHFILICFSLISIKSFVLDIPVNSSLKTDFQTFRLPLLLHGLAFKATDQTKNFPAIKIKMYELLYMTIDYNRILGMEEIYLCTLISRKLSSNHSLIIYTET